MILNEFWKRLSSLLLIPCGAADLNRHGLGFLDIANWHRQTFPERWKMTLKEFWSKGLSKLIWPRIFLGRPASDTKDETYVAILVLSWLQSSEDWSLLCELLFTAYCFEPSVSTLVPM